MKMKAEQLTRRRQELIARCADQRYAMTLHGRSFSQSMSIVDSALALLGRIRQHPGWIVGLAIGLIAIKPRRVAAFLHGSSVALRTFRMVEPVVRGLRARR